MDENIGYNGAYTGSQIDAAIGAVRNKETTWDSKQDKLTGVQGQVVGFDDEGDAIAMPAPDTGVTTFNNRSGAVTPQAGDYSADMIEFADGETFQQKYDAGELTGPQGEQGPKGDTGAPGADGEQGPSGENGGYYTPTVSDTGDLTWAASKTDMPSVAGTNIKGPKGDQGDPGDTGPQGETGPAGAAATINGVNALTLEATGGLTGSQSGSTYTISGNGLKPLLRTATLTTSGWSSNSQTVTVSGVVADTSAQLITVSPADKASATAWGEAGVFCSAQGANSLTFVCDSTPSANISVNISIQEAQT